MDNMRGVFFGPALNVWLCMIGKRALNFVKYIDIVMF